MQKKEHRLNNDLFDNLIFITIKVGHENILAMFDTGASISIISQSLAKKFHCLTDHSLSAGNNNGKLLTLESSYIDRIEICGLEIENLEIGIVPDNYFDLGVDEIGRTFPAQILLGWDIISRFYWRVDTKNKLYCFAQRGNIKGNNLLYNNFPTIKLKYKNEFVLFGFDTGHTETLLDKTWCTKLDNLQPIEDELRGVGSSSVEQSFISNNFELSFENEKFCLKKVTVLERSIYGMENNSAVGLLGIDFFKNSIFEIDYSNKYFHIEKYDKL